jgi:hypothetical protein
VIEPGTYDIKIHQGATFSLEVQYKDSAGNGVDMAGYAVEAKLANRLDTSDLATFTPSWVDQSAGKFKIKLSASQTAGITVDGQYDILITEPGGDKYYLLQGQAILDRGITGV